MPFDMVIQDSDDDEELSPEKTTRVPLTNHVDQYGAESLPAQQEVDNDSHIRVNFDQFLQSQDAAHTVLSPAQQRREDRWIPAVGRVGSMGTMMKEIDIAQQRLFNDDHQAQYSYKNPPVEFHEPGLEPTHAEDINQGYLPQEEALPANHISIASAHDAVLRVELHGAPPSDDWSQSAPSYNIFDSSNHTPSNQLNRADFIRDSGITTQTELMQNLEARRWASMQGAISSPHDTEPFSSIISPKAARVKSDNIAQNTIQPSTPSVDELALPATAEMPKVEKRGRKKKHVAPADDEDDELSHAVTHDTRPNKPEKRKPGRPPKTPKVSKAMSAERADAPSHPSGSPTIAEAPQILPEASAECHIVPPQIFPDGHTEDPQMLPHELNTLDQDMEPPPKPKKQVGKKKVKRSKTTSVTLTKTVEPDVEDDVIWIDERPIAPPEHEDQTNPGKAGPDPAPVPKKRGRKRKKTAEQLENEAEIQARAEVANPVEETNNPEELNVNLQKPGISVVLKNNTRNQTPDITNPDLNLEQDTPEPQPPLLLSPTKESNDAPEQPPETPRKTTDPKTPSNKGPGKHSPISSTCKVPYRVGLSKKARIAPLLKIIKR
ncbi:hypothetical protein BJY01DRAFT_142484 [Aspergillus pseudoustus]|uniref:Uncharacterized protein n=1 Tax=Aspergillus pseudoustus TaxID=1810923 RepID=A0ABR4KBB3_9EURO